MPIKERIYKLLGLEPSNNQVPQRRLEQQSRKPVQPKGNASVLPSKRVTGATPANPVPQAHKPTIGELKPLRSMAPRNAQPIAAQPVAAQPVAPRPAMPTIVERTVIQTNTDMNIPNKPIPNSDSIIESVYNQVGSPRDRSTLATHSIA